MTDTIPAILARQAAAQGEKVVLRKKQRGLWVSTSWSALRDIVAGIVKGLAALGFGDGDVAAVLCETRPEAAHIDLGILGAGGASVAIHPDEDADRLRHILRGAGCRVAFVENEEQLDKVLSIRADCPGLSRIVIIDMKGLRDFADPQCIALDAFVADAAGHAAPTSEPAADKPALILFPRGPNSPMGQMLTHADVMRLVAGARTRLGATAGDERLAVLPMSDPTERIMGLYRSLSVGAISNYLENPETAVENLQQLQPTLFGANAETWRYLHNRITAAAANATRVQRLLYHWALGAGASGLADLIVLRSVRQELGFARLRVAYVGDDAPPEEVTAWARALGITIHRLTDPAQAGHSQDQGYRDLLGKAFAPA